MSTKIGRLNIGFTIGDRRLVVHTHPILRRIGGVLGMIAILASRTNDNLLFYEKEANNIVPFCFEMLDGNNLRESLTLLQPGG